MTELFFNDIKLDLGKSVITETRQINSFFELRDRQTNFTNRFTIPETPKNVYAMEMFGAVGANSNTPYVINNVSVRRNGIPTIQNGKGIVQKRTYGKGYTLNIQYGNYSLFDVLGNKKLSELDFSSINHTFTTNVFFLNLNNTWSDGYLYPLGDYGFTQITTNGNQWVVDARYQMQCVFKKWLWNEIFNQAGFSYSYSGTNNIFDDPDFENTLITITDPKENIVGETIDFSERLTGISQKDFIKSVMQDYGLMLKREDFSTNYEFISVQDFLDDESNIVDLSRKFDRRISDDATLKGYAQSNDMLYNYDNEDDDFADGSFEVANDTVQQEVTMFTSPFKAPVSSNIFILNKRLLGMIFFEASLNDDGTVKEVKEKKNKPYNLTTDRSNFIIRYTFDDGNAFLFFNESMPFVNFSGLTYTELISKSYNNFINLLQKPELFEVTMVFNSIDVKTFDFFNKVYISQLGGVFYMNKIKSYKAGFVTKCELIKVPTIEKLGAYSDGYSDGYLV